MATIKDIAMEAGVSAMTVSRVINGHRSKVSDQTIQKVQAAIEKYGYVPNLSARSLSSKSSHIIAVVLPGNGDALQDPYNAAMASKIIAQAQAHGYYVMLHFTNNYKDITTRLQTWNVDGAIFLGTFDESIRAIQAQNNIPLVFTDSYAHLRQMTNVGIDDYKGGVLAAEHLLAQGHRSLAFVGTSVRGSGVVQHRLKGFRNTLCQAGVEMPEENILDVETCDPVGRLCALRRPVTGILTSADRIAISLISGLRTRGMDVPRDYSVIGFDDLPIDSQFLPRLTTIEQDISRKAEMASSILFRHMKDPDAPSENICLDVQLICRDSVRRL